MTRTILPVIMITAILSAGILPPAHALTADNVDCKKCVGNKDLANKAVTGKKIKKSAVTNKKIKKNTIQSNRIKNGTLQKEDLSESLVGELAAGFLRVVDNNGKLVGPLHTGFNVSGALLRLGGGAEYGMLWVGRNGFYSLMGDSIYYVLPGCKGGAYTVASGAGPSFLYDYLGVGFDPANGKLAALVVKVSGASKVTVAVNSRASAVTDGAGNIVYKCFEGASFQDVMEVKAVQDISVFSPPFGTQNGQ